MTMAFEYLEIRPCIDQGGNITSFTDVSEFNRECGLLTEAEWHYSTCWTLYGRYADDAGQLLAMAIGDFSTKEDAFDVMNAILGPMAQARDELTEASRGFDLDDRAKRRLFLTAVQDVTNDLEDFINQSSSRERL